MRTDIIPYFTYFLALQKCRKQDQYTIHGLWVDYTRSSYPEFCNTEKFDVNELSPIISELNIYWKSCYSKSDSLWKHEWLKHATCFEHHLELFTYFNKTLSLYHEYSDVIKKECHQKDCMIKIPHYKIDL